MFQAWVNISNIYDIVLIKDFKQHDTESVSREQSK